MAASSSTILAEKNFKFNKMARIIASFCGADSTDCCFRFRTEGATNEVKQIKAHRKLLSTLSPVFEAMFSGSWDNDSNAIPIVDASFESFYTFMEYFYKGEVKLNADNINEMLYLAQKYDVQDVVASCSMFSMEQLSIENVIPYFGMAIRYDQADLMAKCADFITGNMDKILKSNEFIQCDQDTLKQVLKLWPENCKAHDVFDSCIEWAKEKCRKEEIDESSPVNLRIVLGGNFQSIQIKRMNRDEFAKRFELINAMMSRNESDDVFKHFVLTKIGSENQCDGINFTFAMVKESRISTIGSPKMAFELSEPLMLEGITIANPYFNGTFDHPHTSTKIVVYFSQNPGENEYIHNVRTTSEAYSRVTFPQPLFMERRKSHEIGITYSRCFSRAADSNSYRLISNIQQNTDVSINLHSTVQQKWKSIELKPSKLGTAYHFISALHFQPCSKNDTK